MPTAIVPAPSSVEWGRRAMAQLLEKDPHLEAVYCSSDGFAQGLMIEAQSRGLRIPQDLVVCGFGDADFSAHLHPSLTSVHIDGAGIGRLAAQLIIDRCAGKAIAQPIIDVGFNIIERQTTAAA